MVAGPCRKHCHHHFRLKMQQRSDSKHSKDWRGARSHCGQSFGFDAWRSESLTRYGLCPHYTTEAVLLFVFVLSLTVLHLRNFCRISACLCTRTIHRRIAANKEALRVSLGTLQQHGLMRGTHSSAGPLLQLPPRSVRLTRSRPVVAFVDDPFKDAASLGICGAGLIVTLCQTCCKQGCGAFDRPGDVQVLSVNVKPTNVHSNVLVTLSGLDFPSFPSLGLSASVRDFLTETIERACRLASFDSNEYSLTSSPVSANMHVLW